MDIGYRIKQRREELGMSQTELANKLGYSNKSAISRIENNVVGISSKKIPLFAKALECSEVWLANGDTFNKYTFDEVFRLMEEGSPEEKIVARSAWNRARILQIVQNESELSPSQLEQVVKFIDFLLLDKEI